MLGGALCGAVCNPECGSDAALEVLSHLSVMRELDTMPTAKELSKAINCFTSKKAPGKDGIHLKS